MNAFQTGMMPQGNMMSGGNAFQTGAPMQQPMMGSFGTMPQAPTSMYAGGMSQPEKMPSFLQQKQQ